MSRAAVLIGRLITDAIVFTAQAALLLAVGYGFGFRIGGGLPLAAAAAIIAAAVAFGLAFAVLSAWLGLLLGDPETAERVLFFPAIAVAFVSSAFAPAGLLDAADRPGQPGIGGLCRHPVAGERRLSQPSAAGTRLLGSRAVPGAGRAGGAPVAGCLKFFVRSCWRWPASRLLHAGKGEGAAGLASARFQGGGPPSGAC
jgi:hypothetical protein